MTISLGILKLVQFVMHAVRRLWGGNFFVFWGVVAQEPRPPQGQAERFVDVLDREDGGRQPQESGAPINHRPREIVICTTFALPRRWSV